MDLLDSEVHALIGDEGFTRLVAAFYRRVPQDPILAPMYENRDLSDAELRLRNFLIMRFGGPDYYAQQRGHPRLRMRHAPFHIDQRGRDRWIELMEQALTEANLPEPAVVALRKFLHDAATFMINR
jgi:hemoglobin